MTKCLNNLKLKLQIHHIKKYSLKAIVTETTSMEMQKKIYLVPVMHGSSEMHLLSIFGALG